MRSVAAAVAFAGLATASTYVGSVACKSCRTSVYERWKKTRMANVVSDPRERPEAVLPDFSKPDPLLTFSLKDVAFVYGSKWKQRYFAKSGDDYYPLPAQWDVTHQLWRAYSVRPGTDWWVPHYGADNRQRPTGPLCDGCHSVNYDVNTKAVTEWNVGCERCHGPGSDHVTQPAAANIVNPGRLDAVAGNDVCIQCHSQGQPLANPIGGRYYDWPVGYEPGKRLRDFWKLEEHKPGETTFTHFPDGTAHKNRMQGNDFVQSLMYGRGITCFSCHDVHGTRNSADLLKPVNAMCLECHGTKSPNGPHAASIEEHTQHKAGSAGGECVACHMPKVEAEIADVNVRSHTFAVLAPVHTAQFGMPNSCNWCHKDKDAAWAAGTIAKWPGQSPWRSGR